MVKKAKLNPVSWLSNVIYLLQNGPIRESDIYEMTNTRPSELCESLLVEHPSIDVRGGMLRWAPFAEIHNQAELYALFRTTYPGSFRRIELRGLYPFVDADLDELLYRRRLVRLDDRLDSMTCTGTRAPLADGFAEAFHEAIERTLYVAENQTADAAGRRDAR